MTLLERYDAKRSCVLPGTRIGSFPIDPLGHLSVCSGRPPASCIKAISNILALPPPTNATNTHQAEVI